MVDRLDQILKAHANTLGWIYDEQGPGIAQWLVSGSGVLWIQGKPGSGKSTAMKFMLQDDRTRALLDMRQRGSRFTLIGCFFTDRASRVQASWNGVLHSMIHQLVSQNPAAMHNVIQFWRKLTKRKSKRKPIWSASAMEDIIRCLKSRDDLHLRVCFFIDALDEHDGNHGRMCNFLHDICTVPSATSVFKVCVASRPENDLRDLFQSDLTISIHDWTNGDIQRFVSEKFSQHPRWRRLASGHNIETAARIKKLITSRARGVFLWVRLIVRELLEELTNGSTLVELEQQTNELPDDLDDFYAHIIKKIDKKYYAEFFIIVEALLRSSGPLSASFLNIVLVANLRKLSKKTSLSSTLGKDEFDNEGFSRRLQSRTGGLIEMVTSNQKFYVQFLHQTVKEYFSDDRNLATISQGSRAGNPEMSGSFTGHFFLLNAHTDLFRQDETARDFPRESLEEIIHHASAIEQKFHPSLVPMLQELDLIITRRRATEFLWPFEALGPIFKRNYAIKYYVERERLPQHHSLLLLAIALGWSHYVQQCFEYGPAQSIRNIGVCQFTYLCCPLMSLRAMPVVKSTKFLIEQDIDIAKCQNLGDCCQADGLGFFVSTHLRCLDPKLKNSAAMSDHKKAIHLLLKRKANPRGKCRIETTNSDGKIAHRVGTIAEALILMYGLKSSIHLIELLGAFSPEDQGLSAFLFDTSPGKVLESPALERRFDETMFIWLRDNGAYISETVASRIYEPFVVALRRSVGREHTYAKALELRSETKMDDAVAGLEKSLLKIYELGLDRDICPRDKFLLSPEQRQPEYYDAAGRRFAAEFNTHWPIEQATS